MPIYRPMSKQPPATLPLTSFVQFPYPWSFRTETATAVDRYTSRMDRCVASGWLSRARFDAKKSHAWKSRPTLQKDSFWTGNCPSSLYFFLPDSFLLVGGESWWTIVIHPGLLAKVWNNFTKDSWKWYCWCFRNPVNSPVEQLVVEIPLFTT